LRKTSGDVCGNIYSGVFVEEGPRSCTESTRFWKIRFSSMEFISYTIEVGRIGMTGRSRLRKKKKGQAERRAAHCHIGWADLHVPIAV
jgi:hypothetical protein